MEKLENSLKLETKFLGAALPFCVFKATQRECAQEETKALQKVTTLREFSFGGLIFLAEYVEFCGMPCLSRLWPSLGGSLGTRVTEVDVDSEQVNFEQLSFEQWSRDLMLAPFKSQFQKQVLLGLLKEAPTKTLSYSELAGLAGSPGATRAVATVMAQNPWPVIFPCHRVLPKGSTRRNVGQYGGGKIASGVQIKTKLLEAEGLIAAEL